MPDLESSNSHDLKERGDGHFKKGEYHEAIQFYLKALTRDPYYIRAWNNLGYSFFSLGQDEDASQCKRIKKELESLQEGHLKTFEEERHIPKADILACIAGMKKKYLPPQSADLTIPHGEDVNESMVVFKDGENLLVSHPGEKENPNPPHETPPPAPKKNMSWIFPGSIKNIKTNSDSEGILRRGELNRTGIIKRLRSLHFSRPQSEFPENGHERKELQNGNNEIRKAVIISIVIGICLFFFLSISLSETERYTQFYLLPASIQNNPQTNTTSFTYGVKSFEHEATPYQLFVYSDTSLVETRAFTLLPGENREENITFFKEGLISFNPKKISVTLKSPHSTYDLHYWIKK